MSLNRALFKRVNKASRQQHRQWHVCEQPQPLPLPVLACHVHSRKARSGSLASCAMPRWSAAQPQTTCAHWKTSRLPVRQQFRQESCPCIVPAKVQGLVGYAKAAGLRHNPSASATPPCSYLRVVCYLGGRDVIRVISNLWHLHRAKGAKAVVEQVLQQNTTAIINRHTTVVLNGHTTVVFHRQGSTSPCRPRAY